MARPPSPSTRRNSPLESRKRKRSSPRPNLFDVPDQREVEVAQNHGYQSGSLPKRARRKFVHQGVLAPKRGNGIIEDSQQEDAAKQPSQLEEGVEDSTATNGLSGQKWTSYEDRTLQQALDRGMKARDIATTIFPMQGYSSVRRRVVYLQTKALRDKSQRRPSPTVEVSPHIRPSTTFTGIESEEATIPLLTEDKSSTRTNGGSKWATEEDRVLQRALNEGKTPKKIAGTVLPGKVVGAVINRAARLQGKGKYLKDRKPINSVTTKSDAPTSPLRTSQKHTQPQHEEEQLASHMPSHAQLHEAQDDNPDRNNVAKNSREWTSEEDEHILHALVEGKEGTEIAGTAEKDFPSRTFDEVRARVRHVQRNCFREMLAAKTPVAEKIPDVGKTPGTAKTPATRMFSNSSSAFPSSAIQAKKWTPEDSKVLRNAVAEGKTPAQILHMHFPSRSYESVRGQVRKLRERSVPSTAHPAPPKWTPEEDQVLLKAHAEQKSFVDIAKFHLQHRNAGAARKRLQRIQGCPAPLSSRSHSTTSLVTDTAEHRIDSKWEPEEDRVLIEEMAKNTPMSHIASTHFQARSLDGVRDRWSLLQRTNQGSLKSLVGSSSPAQLEILSTPAPAPKISRGRSLQPSVRESPGPSASSALAKIRDMKKAKHNRISRSVSTGNASLSSSPLDDPSQTQLTILPGGKVRLQSRSRSQSRRSSQIRGEEGGENDEAYHSQSSPTKQNHDEKGSMVVQPPAQRSNSVADTMAEEQVDVVVDRHLDLAHDPISDDSDYDDIDDDELRQATEAMPSSPPMVSPRLLIRHSHSPVQEVQNAQIRSPSPTPSDSRLRGTTTTSKLPFEQNVNSRAPSFPFYAPLPSTRRMTLSEAENDPISRVASPSQQLLESSLGAVSMQKSAPLPKTVHMSKRAPPPKTALPSKAAPKPKAISPAKNTFVPVTSAPRYVPIFSATRLARMQEDDDDDDDESSNSSASSSSDESDSQPLARTLVQLKSTREKRPPPATSTAIAATAKPTSASVAEKDEAEETSSGGTTAVANHKYISKQDSPVDVGDLIDEALETLKSVPGTTLKRAKAVVCGKAEEDDSSSEENISSDEDTSSDESASGSESEADSDDEEESEIENTIGKADSNVRIPTIASPAEAANTGKTKEDGSSQEEDEEGKSEEKTGSNKSESESEDESDAEEHNDKKNAVEKGGSNISCLTARDDATESEWGGLSDVDGKATRQSAEEARSNIDDANDSSAGEEEEESSSEEEEEEDDSSSSSEDGSSSEEEDSSDGEDSSSDDDNVDESDDDIKIKDVSVKGQLAHVGNKSTAGLKFKPATAQKNHPAVMQKSKTVSVKPQHNGKHNKVPKKNRVEMTDQQDEIARLLEETAGLKSSQPSTITKKPIGNGASKVIPMQEIASQDVDEEMGEAGGEAEEDLDAETNWLMDRVKRKMRHVLPIWG
jgi:hypothetical protein